ncbi:hypothetical protein [Actinomadura macrotermitis]|uniref:Uncharacterized protein n=1 Tax=Actinomadura macrotermitis TaxID=2585200 RepID=A0A7K0C1R5_9ACTN|nr:hypothetical protein [Actinomadura macrotermitis]MQY07340.1 hypothetical protein [Actinomadura macrotermitis]
MSPTMMRPARLAQTAVAAFEEAMALQGRPASMIRYVADTARGEAEEALADVPVAPAREALDAAFSVVSGIVRRLLGETEHLPDAVNAIRDEAHKRARQVDAVDAPDSRFVREARRLICGEAAQP